MTTQLTDVTRGQARYVTADEIAAALSLSTSTVYYLAKQKNNPMPGLRLGNRWRFNLAEVEEWARNGR